MDTRTPTCRAPSCHNLLMSVRGRRLYCSARCKSAYFASVGKANKYRKHHDCRDCGAERDDQPGPALCSKCRNKCRMCGAARTLHFRICQECKPEYDRLARERQRDDMRARAAAKNPCRGCGVLGAFRGTCESCRPLCASCWHEPKHLGSSYCRACKNDKMKRRFRVASGIPEEAESRTNCLECENPLKPAGVHTSVAVTMRFCSQTCRYRYKNRQRRARRLNVRHVEYSRADILERDGWKCQICTKAISRRLKFPHPMSPSIDHIIPLTKGGTDEPKNVQAAHWKCNVDKGNRAANDQLRLVG